MLIIKKSRESLLIGDVNSDHRPLLPPGRAIVDHTMTMRSRPADQYWSSAVLLTAQEGRNPGPFGWRVRVLTGIAEVHQGRLSTITWPFK